MTLAEVYYAGRSLTEQVQQTNTSDGRPLWELMRSDNPLGLERWVNAS